MDTPKKLLTQKCKDYLSFLPGLVKIWQSMSKELVIIPKQIVSWKIVKFRKGWMETSAI